MAVLWLCVISGMLATYAILDGFDLGSGVIHLFLGRTGTDRRLVPAAAPRFRGGNELWLLLAGGALYCVFPTVYASPGFHLAAFALLGLVMLRGLGMAFRDRVGSRRWRRVLDIGFSASSLLIAAALGIAVGCVLENGADWFLLLCGLCGLAVVTLQGASWMALHSTGELQFRCRRLVLYAWWAVVLCYAAVTAASLAVHPQMLDSLMAHSRITAAAGVFAVIALAGLMGTRLCLSVGFDLGTFAGASCVVVGLVGSAAAGQTAPPSASAAWWLPAFVLTAGCIIGMHRLMRNRLAAKGGNT